MEITTAESAAQLIKLERDKFIEIRSVIIREVDMFFSSIKNLDPERTSHIKYPEGKTAQELLPSLWVEPFDKPKYLTELESFTTFVQQIKDVTTKLNNEAMSVLRGA